MFDTHVHSTFSNDGQSTLLEYSKIIDEGKVEGIGFAEHLNFLPEDLWHDYLDYSKYIKTINEFKEKGYLFFAGCEVDYSTRVEAEMLLRLKQTPFEYIIGSVHFINGFSISGKSHIDSFSDRNIFLSVLDNYYNEVKASLKVTEFDIIGHVGVYKRYLKSDFFTTHKYSELIEELDNEVAELCARSGKILEANTSGLFAESGSPMPNLDFLRKYYNAGGRAISIGSDAHNFMHTGRGIKEVKQILKSIGFKYSILPWMA